MWLSAPTWHLGRKNKPSSQVPMPSLQMSWYPAGPEGWMQLWLSVLSWRGGWPSQWRSLATPWPIAFDEKCRKAHQACANEGIAFIPLPVETLGGWHPTAVDQIRKLARALARSTGKEEEESTRHLFQKLGVLLVRGNAAMFLNRIPSFPPPDIDGEE